MSIEEATKLLENNGFVVSKKPKTLWSKMIWHNLGWYFEKNTQVASAWDVFNRPVGEAIRIEVRKCIKEKYSLNTLADLPDEMVNEAVAFGTEIGKQFIEANLEKWCKTGRIKLYK